MLIIIGVIIRASGNSSTEFRIRFDDKCKSTLTTCDFDIIVREDAEGPFYIYVHFSNFHINHRQVMRSFNAKQLSGQAVSFDDIDNTCGNKLRNKDLNISAYRFNTGASVDPEAMLAPCGILPSLIPMGTRGSPDQITFDQYGENNAVSDMAITTKDMNYPNLKGNKFKITDENRNKLYLDIEDRKLASASSLHRVDEGADERELLQAVRHPGHQAGQGYLQADHQAR